MVNKFSGIKDVLDRKELSAIILINTSLNKLDPNIKYFAHKTFEYCALVLKRSKPILIVPELEYGRAKSLIKDFDIKIIKQRNMTELLHSLKIMGNIGLNFEYLSVMEFNDLKSLKIKAVDISSELKAMRMQKFADEQESIRTAAGLADEIMSNLFIRLKTNKKSKLFRTELDIMNFLEDETKRLGLKTSFKPIIASGKNSANPHHDAEDNLVKGFCIIDFGVKYRGYCSDMTRTIYLGKPSEKEQDIYDIVAKANTGCIDFSQSGRKCSEIHEHCKKILGSHSKYFIHGLGHGIGIEIHEGPTLNSSSKDILKEGMVFTIEPGAYIPNRFGVRIEDDVILLANGKKEIITETTKELLCFDI